MKKFIIVLVLVSLCFCGVFAEGTNEYSVDAVQTRATEQAMKEANVQTGMPSIVNFQEKKLMKMILELRDKSDLICYAYSYSEYTGKYTYIGQCVGYGLPYSVQYTNPERMEKGGTSGGGYWGTTIPQPDPNGLFMPDGLSATWVMLIDPNTGEPHPMYMEPSLTVSQFPLPSRICVDGVNK